MRTRAGISTLAVAAIAVLSGCSQISALTPVAGGPVTTVRNATYEVLIDADVAILVAPQCTAEESTLVCVGTTVDGAEIRSEAEPSSPYPLTVTIDGDVVFTGNAEDVIEAAALEGS